MQKYVSFLSNISIDSVYGKVGAIVVLIFLLILSLAFFRQYLVKYSVKGVFTGIFFGLLLALFIEGFLLIAGRTALTELLGWKNAPKPLKTALDLGQERLVKVLGTDVQIKSSNAFENSSIEDAVNILQSLNPDDIRKVKAIICQP